MSRFVQRALLALIVVGAVRCAYSPDPASDTLHCGVRSSCPDGYTCANGTTCWKNGESPSGTAGTGAAGTAAAGMAGTTGAAGTGAAGTTAPSAQSFIGRWIFVTGTETVSCSDNSITMPPLVNDYMDITAGTVSPLVEDYFCPWNENLNAAATATSIRPAQSCTRNMTDATTGVTRYTWHGTTFNMSTLDGVTATLTATIGSDYLKDSTKTGCGPTAAMSCTGTCTITINGTLGKCPGVNKPNCKP